MELNYTEILQAIKIRKMQITQAALEDEALNTEFMNISQMENMIFEILKAHKAQNEKD